MDSKKIIGLNKNRIQQNLLPFIELLKQNDAPYFYFSGGCLRDILLGKKPNDYDMFTTSLEDVDKLVDILKTLNFQEMYSTEHSVKLFLLNIQVDISKEFFTEPLDTKRNKGYDFTINCIAFDSDYNLYYHKNFFKHLSDLSLVRVNTSPPLLEMRYIKFLSNNFYSDYTPLSKIEDMDIKSEKLLATHSGNYPKINLEKFCNNNL